MNNTKDDCPSLMSDGRVFTDCRSSRYRDAQVQGMNDNELRRYLQRNGANVLAANRQVFFGQLCQTCERCDSCRAKPTEQPEPAEK